MLAILAQANNGGPPDEFMLVLVAGVCGFYLVLLLAVIFFLVTLHKALARCRPRNRTMEPGLVWLNLIPLFHLVWMFITAIRVSESLDNEFYARRWHRRGEDYAKSLGIITCALYLCGMIPYCGVIFVLAALVCWIIYWVKVANLSGQLAGGGRYDDEYDDEDDYYDEDDRPRRRRSRDEDADDDRGEHDPKPWERRER